MSKQRTRARSDSSVANRTGAAEVRNYRLGERIAQEELATVYAATHTTLDRPVQVHILRRTDWVSSSRFQLAGRLAARLSHPNLLPIIDAGHDDQYGNYLVTPDVQARRLSDLIEAGPLDPVRALRIMTQIAAVLDYLHENNVIHRDVQPSNILVTEGDSTYLTNLSLASGPDAPDLSSVDEADYLSPYSAPEQRLDQTDPQPTLDIYSLGATLYHMLSGQVPEGSTPPSLASVQPDLGRVDAIVQRMLADNPAARPATANEAVTLLRSVMRAQIDRASPDMEESRWEPLAEWLENPLEMALGGLLRGFDENTLTADTPAETVQALREFKDYLTRSRTRADQLHRGDSVRRTLTRWSNQRFWRRAPFGRLIELTQVISYNIFFYELRTLYETRSSPQIRERAMRTDDRRPTLPPPPSVWDAPVPEPADPFGDVRSQDVTLPNSLNIFTCPQCSGGAEVYCPECEGVGMLDKIRRVRNPDNSFTDEVISEQCPRCRGYGRVRCDKCEGNGNLVEEAYFTWSRQARLWENSDDIEDLPASVLRQRAEEISRLSINLYAGHWHSVQQLDELLTAAIANVKDTTTRIITSELVIRAVPITEVEYTLNDQPHVLFIVGFDNAIVGDWSLINLERVALIALGALAILALLVWLVLLLV
ncbi:MAG: protein kinase [Chloroflexaceae bacterium]|nr:protein kinase [Chloroflexaceae bacterium]NJL32639.1 protein kinase [Chloroflexaceae bacterium]NJO07120.1 protein kinase [Chloroflexaceae bacterium]